MGKVIFGAIVGAIIAFVWSFVSWMVLPWHNMAIHQFRNPDFVAWVIKENVEQDGVYMAPYVQHSGHIDLTSEALKQDMQLQEAAMKSGPYVFAHVKVGGIDPSDPMKLAYSFLTQLAGALLIGSILLKMGATQYGGRLISVTFIGAIVGILGILPDWTWFGAGHTFTLVMICDLIIQWFLAGLLMAAIVRPRSQQRGL